MLGFKHVLRGDTLIEVTIAIGIFALVAISVVAVVNISTSGAQSALENTLAREEIDAQAETLRFIQSAYENDENNKLNSDGATSDPKADLYKAIWSRVRNFAYENMQEVNDGEFEVKGGFEREFEPKTCDSLYEKNDDDSNYLTSQNAFIVDIRRLNAYDTLANTSVEDFAESVIRPAFSKNSENMELFAPAVTYPRLVYRNIAYPNDEEGLIANISYSLLDSVEGIFVTGVVDENTTSVVTGDAGDPVQNRSAYLDFYVRGCWYNAGSEVPSVLSTMIRLRDPEAIAYVKPEKPEPEPEPDGEHKYMQDITLAECERRATDSSIVAYDRRDESDYTIRYINGACWMTQNLRITKSAGQADWTISKTDSNFDNVNTWNIHGADLQYGSASFTQAQSHEADSANVDAAVSGGYSVDLNGNPITAKTLGVWYNFCAVSAGNSNGCKGSGNYIPVSGVVTGDICPLGWRVPYYVDSSGGAGSFYVMTANALSYFNPVYGGYYNGGSLKFANGQGYWWTVTPLGQGSHALFSYANGALSHLLGVYDDTNNKRDGCYVRCVRTS